MKRINKQGISVITILITISVLLILSTVVIVGFGQSGIMNSKEELSFKSELKNYDEEIRVNIDKVFVRDSSIINKVITDRDEIAKYCKGLVESEYIDYAYISKGVLTLRRKMLTEKQIQWAIEAKIKLDDGQDVPVIKSVELLY